MLLECGEMKKMYEVGKMLSFHYYGCGINKSL